MELVIETNLLINEDETIRDHQSRVVEVESWESYAEEIKRGDSVERRSFLGHMDGKSLIGKVLEVEFDDHHGSCITILKDGVKTKKLLYRVR
jgi:hypothetical protein